MYGTDIEISDSITENLKTNKVRPPANSLCSLVAYKYTNSPFVTGRMNVTVQYLPGSQHKVLMSVDGVCINDELVNKKLAIQRLPGTKM